jgi:hypothetical protein
MAVQRTQRTPRNARGRRKPARHVPFPHLPFPSRPAVGGPAAIVYAKRSIPAPVLPASCLGPTAVLVESYPDPTRLLLAF